MSEATVEKIPLTDKVFYNIQYHLKEADKAKAQVQLIVETFLDAKGYGGKNMSVSIGEKELILTPAENNSPSGPTLVKTPNPATTSLTEV
jgi:hypothetical protein